MKFSYYLPCYYTDKAKPAAELYKEAEYQAQYAEQLGYDAVVIPEHYFMNYLAVPNLLMFAVRVSQLVKLRVMSAVIPIPLYHPLQPCAGHCLRRRAVGGPAGDRSRAGGIRA